MKINLVKRAIEKYELLTNGIKSSIDKFLKDLEENKIKKEDMKILFEGRDKVHFYYERFDKMYIIFTEVKEGWLVVDFLTMDEFPKFNK